MAKDDKGKKSEKPKADKDTSQSQFLDFVKNMEAKMKSLNIDKNCLKMGGGYIPVEFLSTGQMEVDAVLGEGMGIPKGTLIEFCGESQSGKTYLAYKLMAQANAEGKRACFFNIENSFYPPRAESLGVKIYDPNLFTLFENIATAEQYGEMIKFVVSSGLYDVVVVDSITALIPSEEYVKTLGDAQTIGIHARFMKRLSSRLVAECAKAGTICVYINQLYISSGKQKGTFQLGSSGGNSINYFTHMRLWINKIGGKEGLIVRKNDEGKEEVIGGKSKLLVMKTRYGTPGLKCEFPIMFGKAESNPIDEFMFKAKNSKPKEFIKETRKVFKYVNDDTGEVLESKDAIEFIEMLQKEPAPLKMPRGVKADTAFEWICNRLKLTPMAVDAINNALNNPSEKIYTPEVDDEYEIPDEVIMQYQEEQDQQEIEDEDEE